MMRLRLALFLAGLALLGVSLACGAGGGASPDMSEPAAVPTAAIPTAVAQPAQIVPALYESRRLTLEFPPTIRVGDADVLRLTLEVDTLGGLTPTVEVEGHKVTGETVQVPNMYETHRVVADARLDLAGMQIEPAGTISEQLLPGQTVRFYWSLRSSEPGRYRGTVWLHLRFQPLSGGDETRTTISSQVVEIRAVKFLGLAGGPARLLGALGSVLGTVLGLPFIENLLRWIWRRLRRGG